MSLLSLPKTQTRAAQVSTPGLSSETPTRRLLFLLKLSSQMSKTGCSFAHPASYFLHSISLSFTFFDKETNFIREGLCPKEGTRVRVLGVYFF